LSASVAAGVREVHLSPEAASRTLSAEEQAARAAAADPLAEFIGAFDFGPADLAENYHRYLAADPRRPYKAT
jgi:hypothetical protein